MSSRATAGSASSGSSRDPYALRARELGSRLQGLRPRAGAPESAAGYAEALVALDEHRLLGWQYAKAGADAAEAARRCADLLTRNGPLGPYTESGDARRYARALVHVAFVQAGLGLAAPAAQTIGTLDGLHAQLAAVSLELVLDPLTAVWALEVLARADLAHDPARAAGTADLAAAHWAGHADDPLTELVAVGLDRLASDTRWRAGHPDAALAAAHRAVERHETLAAGRLDEPGRLPPVTLERLAAALFPLRRDLADRLLATGETDLALVTRRQLAATLRRLVPAYEPAGAQLALTLADLAADLASADRLDEATAAAAEAAGLARAKTVPDASRSLVARVATEVERRAAGEPSAYVHLDDPDRGALVRAPSPLSWGPAAVPAWLSAEEPSPTVQPDVREASQPGPGVGPAAWEEAWLADQRADAQRAEAARAAQAARDASDRAADERAAAERAAIQAIADAEQARRDEADRAAAEEAERQETKRRRLERLETHRRQAESVARAEQDWRDASARGDKAATKQALGAYVDVLRDRAADDPGEYAPRLVTALEALARAQLLSGEVLRSRATAKEARQLARSR